MVPTNSMVFSVVYENFSEKINHNICIKML